MTVRLQKSWLCLFFVLAAWVTQTQAQLSTQMIRSTFTGTYTPITGTAATSAQGDDVAQSGIPIGFSFTYLGTAYTTINACSNGWANFGTSATTAANTGLGTTGTPNATLALWWDDLSSSSVQYLTTGTAGSQVFTLQWTSLSYYTGSTRTINYQLKLYEGTNIIEFWYGAVSSPNGTNADGYTSESASIGIENATGGPGNFIDAISGSSQIYNGTLNSGQWPTVNYRFTPGAATPIAAGTYNVGAGQTYTTLTEAVANINHRGIAGAVTLNLTDAAYIDKAAGGNETFPIVFGPVGGTSATNTITLQGNGADLRYAGSVSGSWGNGSATGTMFANTAETILGLCGTDYLTVNNVKLLALTGNVFGTNTGNPTRVDRGLAVQNCADNTVAITGTSSGAQNNTFTNLTVTLDRTNTNTMAIDQGTSTIPTSAVGANSGNKYLNLTIRNSCNGISLGGNLTWPDIGCEIGTTSCTTFNIIGDPNTSNDIGSTTVSATTYGISATNQSGIKIYNNSVRNVTNANTATTTSTIYIDGIALTAQQGVCEVYNNKIQGIRNVIGTASAVVVTGIRVLTGASTPTLRIYNNSISDITSSYTGAAVAVTATASTRQVKGIFLNATATAQTYEVYNNSVSLDMGSFLNVSSVGLEIASGSAPIHKIANNVFANFTAAQGAVAKHIGFFSTSATAIGAAGSLSNNNDFFIANDLATSGQVVQGSTTYYPSVAAWTTASTQDAASLNTNPQFGSNTSDLHSASAVLNGAGQAPPAYVVNDLDCIARTSPHNIGAYNINACSTVAGGTISPATASRCAGTTYSMSSVGASTAAVGLTYQWEVSTVGGGVGFAPVSGANTTAYTTGALTAGTYYYRLNVTCSAGPTTAYSNELTLTVNPLPTVVATPTSATFCTGTPVSVTASGADTYAWSPATGLSATTGATVNASPSQSTTYTVTGTITATGCTNTATSAITTVQTPQMVTATATPSTICSGASTTLTGSASVTNTHNIGTATGILSTIGSPYRAGVASQVRTQLIYTAAELTAAGMVAGPISGLGFTASSPTGTVSNLEIRIGHTALSAFSGTTFATSTTSLVFTQASFTPVNGLNMHTFNAGSFNWDGTSNLLIQTCQTNNISGTAPCSTYTATGQNLQTAGATACASSTTGTASTSKPIIRFTTTSTPSLTWNPGGLVGSPITVSPATTTTYTLTATNAGCSATANVLVTVGAPLSATITNTPACNGIAFNLTAVVTGGGAPYTYSWVDQDTSKHYPNAPTISIAPLTPDSYSFDVFVTDACNSIVSTGGTFIEVFDRPTATTTPSAASACGGVAVSLTGSGTGGSGGGLYDYLWYPSTGLSATNTATVSANPSALTTYNVIVTETATGCKDTASVVVNVGNVVTMGAVTATPPAVCAGGTSVLTASATSVGSVNEYTFSAGTGATLDPMTTGTVTNLIGTSNDDTPTGSPSTIGFTFNYNGTNYTQYSVSPDGWILLGATAAASQYTNQITSTTNVPKIYPYWDDVATGTNGYVKSVVNGTAPNRILVVEWFVTIPRNTTGAANSTFQAWLYETSNKIEFRYGTMGAGTMSASVGLTGSVAASQFNSVTIASNTASTTVAADANAGQPASGTIYTFNTPTISAYSWTPGASLVSSTGASVTTTAITPPVTFNVTAVSAAGCTATGSVTVTPATPISPTNITVPSTTCANTNFSLTANTTGGGGTFTYAWNDGAGGTYPNSQTITVNKAAGTYTFTVTITDGCGSSCNMSQSVTINALPTVAIAPTPSNALICGTGSVSLAASGATTYTWTPASGLSAINVATVTATPTATTTYTVSGTDGNGCVNTTTQIVTYSNAVVIIGLPSATPATICAGATTTLAAVASDAQTICTPPTPASGTGFGDYCSLVQITGTTLNNATGASVTPFYTLYPQSGSTTATLTAGNTYTIVLAAGTYTQNDLAAWIDFNNNGVLNDAGEKLGETDDLGASPATTSFTFTVPAGALNGSTRLRVREIYHSTTNDMDPCANQSSYGETEDYIITITGGVNPTGLTYSWDNSAGTTSSVSVSPAATTTYTVTASNAAGCSTTGTASVTVNPLPVVSITGLNAAYCSNVASITLTGSPALGSFTVNGTGATTFDPATAPASNTVVYTYTDGNNCTNTATQSVTVNPLPVVNITGLNANYCSNSSVITLTGSPASGSFTVNGAPSTTFNPATAPTPSTIVYTYTDANSCTNTATQSVGIQAMSNVSLAQSGGITSGTGITTITQACTGSTITLTANVSGPAAATYQWQRNGVDIAGQIANTLALNSGWGVYRVRVTNINSCITNADTFAVNFRSLPNAQAGTDKNTCSGSTVVLGAANNTAYTYTWSPGTNLSNTHISNPVATATSGATNYVVTVSQAIANSGGLVCTKKDTVLVTSIVLPSAPTIAVSAPSTLVGSSSPETCQGTNITLTPSNTTGASYLQWLKNGAQVSLTTSTTGAYTISSTNNTAATYTAKVKAANGCFSGASNAIVANVKSAPVPTISPAGTNNIIMLCFAGGTSASQLLTADVPVGSPTATYTWYQTGVTTPVASNTAQYTGTITNTVTSKSFYVSAAFSNGCVKNSANKTLRKNTTCREIAFVEEDLREEMSAYPNPTHDKLNVSISNSVAVSGTLTLSNAMGQIVMKKTIEVSEGNASEILDLSNLTPGIYNLSFDTDETRQAVKVIKE